MTIASCRLVGVEGTHGTGKTSAATALTSYLADLGIKVTFIPELVRSSPYFGDSPVKVPEVNVQLHILGEQIAAEHRAASTSDLLVCDRTVLSTVAYWRVRTSDPPAWEEEMWRAAKDFCQSYMHFYDLVFLINEPRIGIPLDDGFRELDTQMQAKVAHMIRTLCRECDVPTVMVPSEAPLDAVVSTMVHHMRPLLSAIAH